MVRDAETRRRRSPTKGDRKEAAILDTAWQLLATKPLTSIAIDELASGAGISRSSFYFYFDSREAVVRTLAERAAEDLRAALRLDERSASPRDRVRRQIGGLLGRWERNGPLLRAMNSLAEYDDELRTFWASVTDGITRELAGAIRREQEAGRACPAPPTADELVELIAAMVWRSAYDMSLRAPGERDFEHLADVLTDVVLRVIYGSSDVAAS